MSPVGKVTAIGDSEVLETETKENPPTLGLDIETELCEFEDIIDKNAEKGPTVLSSEDKKVCEGIREFCTPHSIALVLKSLCEAVPEAYPNYRTWGIPDPGFLIWEKIRRKRYVERLLPTLKVLLKDNISNISWTARVVIAMTIYKVVEQAVKN